MATYVLLIDDDEKLGELLKTYLGQFGMKLLAAQEPGKGLELLRRHSPEVVILDVMLPGKDGFQICKEIRLTSRVPIIMLTARGELTDRVLGLEIGADDYLSKPFEPRELVARIQSVLRRSKPKNQDSLILKSGSLSVDLNKRSVSLKKKPLELTTLEFELLSLFLKNPGAVLSRDRIMDELRGVDWEAYNRSVDIAMSRLRRKLGDPVKKPRYFKTVWGSGYLFLGKVESHEA